MGKTYDQLDERLRRWIAAQRMFFVATAPSGTGGHVNLSPKGPRRHLHDPGRADRRLPDLTGSGAETIAHLRDNGRIVLMFCAFSGPPRILRLHGRGQVVLPLPDAMPYRAVSPRLDRRAAGLEGSKVVVVVVVAVAAELRVGCCGQCRTGGRQQTG